MKVMHLFHKQYWQRVARTEVDETSYREVTSREECDISYAKLWRILNMDTSIDIDDYLMVSNLLDIDPMGFIYYE